MTYRHQPKRLLAAAMMALLTGGLAGSSTLVLCLGADGHRAIEVEHGGGDCPTIAGSLNAAGVSAQAPSECLDLPAVGTGPVVSPSSEAAQLPKPPTSSLPCRPEPAPQIEAGLSPPTDARAGPPSLAPHLRSTVLLV